MDSTSRARVRLVNPVGQCRVELTMLAPRLESLSGRSIGFIDNGKPNAGTFLAAIEERMRADFPGLRTCTVRKDSTSSKPIAHELEGRIDAVVNAWGD
jgi:hypothetical protein